MRSGGHPLLKSPMLEGGLAGARQGPCSRKGQGWKIRPLKVHGQAWLRRPEPLYVLILTATKSMNVASITKGTRLLSRNKTVDALGPAWLGRIQVCIVATISRDSLTGAFPSRAGAFRFRAPCFLQNRIVYPRGHLGRQVFRAHAELRRAVPLGAGDHSTPRERLGPQPTTHVEPHARLPATARRSTTARHCCRPGGSAPCPRRGRSGRRPRWRWPRGWSSGARRSRSWDRPRRRPRGP